MLASGAKPLVDTAPLRLRLWCPSQQPARLPERCPTRSAHTYHSAHTIAVERHFLRFAVAPAVFDASPWPPPNHQPEPTPHLPNLRALPSSAEHACRALAQPSRQTRPDTCSSAPHPPHHPTAPLRSGSERHQDACFAASRLGTSPALRIRPKWAEIAIWGRAVCRSLCLPPAWHQMRL